MKTTNRKIPKYGASSSILILDYDIILKKFMVIKRVEVPRSEYSYEAAVNMIVELNDQYNPSFIFCDRGSGEHQIERLHMIGDERPATGLKHKVRGWQFRNNIEITDPVTFQVSKHPMKPFMVTQLQIAFERDMMILSPFDEVLHKQLIDYEVERISAFGDPVFTSKNEHFVDALGLAYLAFVLEFRELTQMIKLPQTSNKIEFTGVQLGASRLNNAFNGLSNNGSDFTKVLKYDPTELPGDRPTMVKVNPSYRSGASGGSSWGSRSSGMRRNGGGRSMW